MSMTDVIIHLLILMSKMKFYVQDESTKCLLYVIIQLLIIMYEMNFYVQDESTKCMIYVIIHLLIPMSKMKFYIQAESTKCLLYVIIHLLTRWRFLSRMILWNVCYMSKMIIYVQDETAEVIKRLVQNDAAKVTNLKNKDEINRIYIYNRPMSETRRRLSHYHSITLI